MTAKLTPEEALLVLDTAYKLGGIQRAREVLSDPNMPAMPSGARCPACRGEGTMKRSDATVWCPLCSGIGTFVHTDKTPRQR